MRHTKQSLFLSWVELLMYRARDTKIIGKPRTYFIDFRSLSEYHFAFKRPAMTKPGGLH